MGRALNLSQFQHNVTDGTTTVGTGFVVNGSAKAWCSFNQQTPAISDSINTSSLTDSSNGQGDLNWTSAMSNTLYTAPSQTTYVSGSGSYCITLGDAEGYSNRTVSKWYFRNVYADHSSSGFYDSTKGQVTIHGDLA